MVATNGVPVQKTAPSAMGSRLMVTLSVDALKYKLNVSKGLWPDIESRPAARRVGASD